MSKKKILFLLAILASLAIALQFRPNVTRVPKGPYVGLEPKPGTLPYCDDMIVHPGALDTEGLLIPRPTYNHVEQVNIVVDVENGESLPAPLRKQNLEFMLTDIYSTRYKPIELCDRCKRYNCYNRTTPPVDVVQFRTPEEKAKAKELSLKPEILTVYVQVKKVSEDTASVRIINYRPHIGLSFWREWLNMPQFFWEVDPKKPPHPYNSIYTFKTEQAEQKLAERLSSYFTGKIR